MVNISSFAFLITYFIKSFIMNDCMFYSFCKISKSQNNVKNISIFGLFNIFISVLYTFIEYKVNLALPLMIIYILFAIGVAIFTKNKLGYSIALTAISYGISITAFVISTIINFPLYKLVYKENTYLNLIGITFFQSLLVWLFFRIKRFKNGFAFLNNKISNDTIDLIISLIGIFIIVIKAVAGTLNADNISSIQDSFIVFIILGITMYIMIQRTLTMQYKQTQLLKTMEEYKEELKQKDKEIEKLSREKYNTSKIRHEFYHRQKALEMLVTSKYSKEGISTENTSENILSIINSLTNEYSAECERIKQLDDLDKTDIPEIDSMFKYMQNECVKSNIEFKLRIIGNIYSLVNNIIPKARLETLIGDHIKDAINAVNDDGIVKKEIFTILGVKDNCYELAVYDTGKEFEIDTLLKLGLECATTCSEKGGSGIGFMTTFETLKETKASLIITEMVLTTTEYYTKSVTIRFDGKQQYIICSHRSNDIKAKIKDNRIMVKDLGKEN